MQDIIEEVERLKFIEVDGNNYEIEYYMGGDWKYLAVVTGKWSYIKSLQASTMLNKNKYA